MRSRLASGVLLLAAIFIVGTVGYRLIEGAPWWDAFYMTVITLTTVGYEEVFPLSRAGEVFTVALILVGLGILLFLVTEIGRFVLEGEIRDALGRVRRTRMIEKLSGHEVVCGWGRMGQSVVDEMAKSERAFVVVERDPEKARRLRESGRMVVVGDATSDETLRAAGVTRARGLVACLNDDVHNLYLTLTARSMNPALFIVARAGEVGAEERLRRAGADRVVNPYHLGGVRLAHLLAKPAVVDFLDFSVTPGGEELDLEQVLLTPEGPLAGKTLAETGLRKRWGVAVVAVKRGEQILPNPDPDFGLEAGDLLVVLGSRERVEAFERGIAAAPYVE